MDRKEVDKLYQMHAPALLGYLTRFLGDADAAADVLQETFVAFMKDSDRTVHRHPRAWLYVAGRHFAIKALKRRRPLPLPEEVPGPAQARIDDRIDKMRQAINRLPEDMRETLGLKLQDGLSYQEIATVLGIPIGTVRSRLHNAVRKLREQLIDENRSEA